MLYMNQAVSHKKPHVGCGSLLIQRTRKDVLECISFINVSHTLAFSCDHQPKLLCPLCRPSANRCTESQASGFLRGALRDVGGRRRHASPPLHNPVLHRPFHTDVDAQNSKCLLHTLPNFNHRLPPERTAEIRS